MHTRLMVLLAILCVCALLLPAACDDAVDESRTATTIAGSTTGTSSEATSLPSETTGVSPQATTASSGVSDASMSASSTTVLPASTTTTGGSPMSVTTTTSTAPAEGVLPDLVGLDLQLAQDTLQAAGWYLMTSYDATGQNRMQLRDRNWVVVEQAPAAGETVGFDKIIELGVVKDSEPGAESSLTPGVVPGVMGIDLQLALDTMQAAGYYLFEYVDATGQGRRPIVHSNWVVVGQSPAAGTSLASDRIVTLEVKKDGE